MSSSALANKNVVIIGGTPEEVAAGILFVMQNGFSTGTTVDVDGGRILS